MVAIPWRSGVLPRSWAGWLGVFGTAAMVTAIVWWAILFPTVVENAGLTLGEALPCIASNSEICSLAMALCGAQHLFGIKQYLPGLFWAGTILLSVSLLVAPRADGRSK